MKKRIIVKPTLFVLKNQLDCTVQPCFVAHMCQLAAKDVTSMFEDALINVRKVAIESKKVAYIQTFKNLKKPCIDIAPHWDSTSLMIEDFHTNAEAYQRHNKLKLNDASWSLIDEYFKAFLPKHSAMMDFHSPKLSMSSNENRNRGRSRS